MKRILLGLLLAGLALGAGVTPTVAFDFSGCGNFELLTVKSITFEAGATTSIEGDIMVIDPQGFVKVGNKNQIKGSVFANQIIVGDGAVVAVCVANTVSLSGTGKCLATITPFVAPPGCTIQPFPPGIVVPQVPLVCTPGTDVVIATDTTLDAGCYHSIKVLKDQTLTLKGGQFYAVQAEFRTGINATVESDTPGTSARLVTKGTIVVSEQSHLTDLFLFQLGAAAVLQIFNNTVLDNVVVVSTSRLIHIHTGALLKGQSALAAPELDVEPIGTLFDVPPPILCVCPTGFVFKADTGRECVPGD